jgi:endonuclease G
MLVVVFGRFDSVTAVSSNLVISQVYGGGGNSGAQLRNDFIEIFNRGAAPVSLAGMSVQYASSAGTSWQVTPLTSVTLAPGQYYLVQEATGAAGTVSLPTPDATGNIAMSATAGKVALVASTTALSGACPAGVVDFVGFGGASCFEGSGATPVLSNTTAALRGANGCTETDDNAGNFSVGAPSPRNTATTPAPCGTPSTNLTGTLSTDPSSGAAGQAIVFTATVTPGTNPASTGITVTGNFSSIGGPSSQPFVQDAAAPNTFTFTTTIAAGTPAGTRHVNATIADAEGRTGTAQTSVTVTGAGDTAPAFASSSPANGAANVLVNAVIAVTFTESVSASGSAFSLTCGGVAHAFAQGPSPNTTHSLTPTAALPHGTTCSVAVSATQIADTDADDPPDQMAADAGFSFTTEAAGPPDSDSAIVISQLYGGGGNAGAVYRNDYVELYNRGATAVDITGWSLQYASATGSSWSNKQLLAGSIGPGQYYLISLAGGTNGAFLPEPNSDGGINMSGSTGKVALVNNADELSGTCPIGSPGIMDFVGYGSSANCQEGATRAPAPSVTTAILRRDGGQTDTDTNGSDFITGSPFPRRTAAFVEVGPTVVFTDPGANGANAPRDATIEVSFSEPVDVADVWFDITCTLSGAHNSATFASTTLTRYITPNDNFFEGEQCTVTIFKDQVSDRDLDDGNPNTNSLPANHVWTFTVATGTPPPFPASVHLAMGKPSDAMASLDRPTDFLMEKAEFALSYNRDLGRPNWVSWHLSDEWIGSLARVDTFRPDPAIPSEWYRVQSFDFFGSGFDRGHLVPNADRDPETSMPINQATFLMSNMIAQAPDNNQGPWAALENYLRTLLPANEVYVVAGGTGAGGSGSTGSVTTTLAGGRVTVPADTWKVALVISAGSGDDLSRVTCSARTIAVVMPNTQGIRNTPWEAFLTTVDAVEALTGYDFFSNLPTAVQRCIEAGIHQPEFSALDAPTIEAGASNVSISGTLSAADVVPPGTVAVTLDGVTVHAAIGADGRFTATFPATALTLTNSPYPIGFSYAGDVNFAGATGESSLRVADTTAPVISMVTTTPDALGPPNHKMIDVTVGYTATDFDGVPVCAVTVTSNEPVNGAGDGNTTADWQVVDEHHVRLRAERAGGGAGRLYTITIRCADASGNASTATASVTVAK